MMAEPVFQPKAAREQLLEALFETHKAPAAFMAKSAVLASYAMGRQTSLMVDAGHDGTTGAPAAAVSPPHCLSIALVCSAGLSSLNSMRISVCLLTSSSP